MVVKIDDRALERLWPEFRWNDGSVQCFDAGQIQFANQALLLSGPVGTCTRDAGKQSARTNDRRQQAAGRHAIAKVEAIRDDPLDTQISRQGTHHMIQGLTDEDDAAALRLQFAQVGHTVGLEMRFQFVLKIFIAQQVEPVAAQAAKYAIDDASRERAVSGIQNRAESRHQEDQPAAGHARREGLGVPGEKGNRLDGGEVEQTAFHTPEHQAGGIRLGGIVSR